MRRIVNGILLSCMLMVLASATVHKYYVAVFQLDHVPEKKALHMTVRFFIDDLETAFDKKYGKKFYFGEKQQLSETGEYLQKYISEKMQVKVNGKAKPVKYLDNETDADVLVCYYTIPAESKVSRVEISDSALFEAFPEQQNIIHVKINGNKKSLLLTNDEPSGTIQF